MLGQIGRQRLIIMAAVAAVMLGVMAIVATRGGDSHMAFLFTDLDPTAAQSIADKLKGQNIPFQLSADGTAVLAPEDKLAELRMSMAGDKLGGKIGYDVLDQEEPFGVSASRAKLNETRVIEGELARSIQTLQSVASARVHIVMPERDLFAAQASKATAAVTVRTKGRLSPEAVQSIRYLVSSSVPELSPSAVSIVDQTGALLARAGDEATMGSGDGDERQHEVENQMRDEIEALLAPIVGQGKVRAKVSADIDRDQTREETDTFDPDKQVIAHQVTVGSKDQSSDTQPAAGGSSVGNQLPEAQAQGGAAGGPTRTQARDETSEDTTYDNSKTHSVVLRGPGRIKRLTVAVMVDGGAKGLPAPTIQRLTRLVENAVGADSARGDSVVIDSMAFAADDTLKDEPPSLLSKLPVDVLINFAKLLAIAAVGLIALKMIRPKPEEAVAGMAGGETLLNAQGQSVGPDGQPLLAADGQPLAIGATGSTGAGDDREISLAQVDGNVKANILNTVGGTIAANPNESVAVIREWMNS